MALRRHGTYTFKLYKADDQGKKTGDPLTVDEATSWSITVTDGVADPAAVTLGGLEPGDYVIEEQATTNGTTPESGTIKVTVVDGDMTGASAVAAFVNNKDVGTVKVTKTFKGLTATKLPANFKITNDYDTSLEFTFDNADNKDTADGITTPYEWTIENVPVDTVITFTESGEGVTGFILEATSLKEKASEAVVKGETVTVEFTNNYKSNWTSATVKKVWNDKDDRDGNRPDNLTINLLANGKPTGKSVTLNAGNNWIGRIDKLDKFDEDGTEITYSWSEEDVTRYGYTPGGTVTSGTLTTLTNTRLPDKTEVRVRKVWIDDGSHPSEVKVQLFADGKAIGETKTLSEATGWKASWKDLPKNDCGDGIVYTVAETEVPEGYEAKINRKVYPDYTGINPEEEELTTDIEVVKIWDDQNNKDGNRPESITIHLFAGGEEIKTATLSAGNGWKKKFGELPKFNKEGVPIRYSVTEDPVKWYIPEIRGFTITNRYSPETVTVWVRKEWDDAGSETLRPKSVSMRLSNGMNVTLTAKNGWVGVISGLPKYVNGQPAVYTWTETQTLGYKVKSKVTKDNVTVITNELWNRPGKPPKGKEPKHPGDTVTIEDYDTPLGVDVMINHVGDCFD